MKKRFICFLLVFAFILCGIPAQTVFAKGSSYKTLIKDIDSLKVSKNTPKILKATYSDKNGLKIIISADSLKASENTVHVQICKNKRFRISSLKNYTSIDKNKKCKYIKNKRSIIITGLESGTYYIRLRGFQSEISSKDNAISISGKRTEWSKAYRVEVTSTNTKTKTMYVAPGDSELVKTINKELKPVATYAEKQGWITKIEIYRESERDIIVDVSFSNKKRNAVILARVGAKSGSTVVAWTYQRDDDAQWYGGNVKKMKSELKNYGK